MKNLLIYLFLALFSAANLHAITLQEAKNLVLEKQYEKAIEAYETLMKQPSYAKNAEACKLFGQALCMVGRYQESIAYLETGAKGNKTGAWWYLGISYQHLYQFSEAIEALEKYKSSLSGESGWIPRTDSIIAECQVGLKGVSHVQDVVIIDSMIVSRKNFFEYYRLGAESGKVRMEGRFENQAGDYRLWAAIDEEKEYHLYEQHKFGEEWGDPQIIESIESNGNIICYPFLRSDSETLFFASDRTPGYGGLDIYKTHYNADSESYFAPERMGMPFNSPYDDFMMAIDETHMVGWWATNRNVSPDSVCIYLFKVDDSPIYLTGKNPEQARVSAIRNTWKDDTDYAAFAQEVKNAPQRIVKQEKLFIPINDAVVYTSIDQFKVEAARQAYEESQTLKEDLQNAESRLDLLREEWHSANVEHRQELKNTIAEAENQCKTLREQYLEARKTYCRLEQNQ